MASNDTPVIEKAQNKENGPGLEHSKSHDDFQSSAGKLSDEWFNEAMKTTKQLENHNPCSRVESEFPDIKNLLNPSEKTLTKPEPSPEDKEKMSAQAKDIAATIGKHGDFHAGMKREQIEEALKDATAKGKEYVDFLVKEINKNLAKTNPNLMLTSSYWTEKSPVSTISDSDPKMENQPYRPFTVEQPHSEVTLINTQTREPEDKIVSAPETQPLVTIPNIAHGIPELDLPKHEYPMDFDHPKHHHVLDFDWTKNDIFNPHKNKHHIDLDQNDMLK